MGWVDWAAVEAQWAAVEAQAVGGGSSGVYWCCEAVTLIMFFWLKIQIIGPLG